MVGKSKLFIGLFLVSLAGNAYLGGVVLGQHSRERKAVAVIEAEKKATVSEIAQSIPELQKQKFRNAEEWLKREVKAQMEEIRGLRAESLKILTAPTFDRAAFDAAEDEILDIRQSIFRKRKNMVGFLASDLSQQDRQRLAKSLTNERAN